MILHGVPITAREEYVPQFHCDDAPDVESYLTQHAVTHHQQNTAHTRLFFDDAGEVIGFFTVLVDLVQIGMGKRRENGWDLDERFGTFPAIKIHYVAVDSRHRNQGCGKEILGKAIHWGRAISERVTFFEQFGFDYCSRKPQSCITADGRHVHMCLYLGSVRSALTMDPVEITA